MPYAPEGVREGQIISIPSDQDVPLQGPAERDAASSDAVSPALFGMRPRRGLVLAHNRRSQYFRDADMHRWLAYSVRVLDCLKVDVLAWGRVPKSLVSTIWYAREFAVPVSLRTDGAAPPDDLPYLAGEGLSDVFLCPRAPEVDSWAAWLDACHRLNLPVRLQLQLPRMETQAAEQQAAAWQAKGVRSVNMVLDDPFQPIPSCRDSQEGRAVAATCEALAEALLACGVEVNLFGYPPALFGPAACGCAMSPSAFYADYQQYDEAAHAFAARLYARRPETVRAALLIAMKRHTVALDITDRWLTEALFVKAAPLYRVAAYCAKRWRAWRGAALPRTLQNTRGEFIPKPSASAGFTDAERQHAAKRLGGLMPQATETSPVSGAMPPRYVDAVDQDRLQQTALWQALAREAQDWQRSAPPDRVCDINEWGTEEAFMVPEYGATAWLSFLPGERLSTKVDHLSPPFMVSLIAGGGMAEAAGFQLSPAFTLLCPLVEARHTVTLYARADGRYVLLRDNVPIEPLRRPGHYTAPHRAPSHAKLRIAVWDIEQRISFSPLRIWKQMPANAAPAAQPKYSIVVFCTRFARRLAAALQCLAHQQNFDCARLEMIVGYVPGLDATEDVLESFRQAHPGLRVIHMPFPRQNIRSKGYVLNQCMDMAVGDWIVLLDADTLLPPNMFAALEQVEAGRGFIFPKGRAMLSPQTTAKILLGEIKPWLDWEALLRGAPALRQDEALGAPIGYCQCFRREGIEKARYPEYEHFQGADFEFAMLLQAHFGKEYRLDFPVLHLDHEGSQWFGADRHF